MLDTVEAFENRLASAVLDLDGMEDGTSLTELIALGHAVEVMRGVVKREQQIREDSRKGGYLESLLKKPD